MIVSMYNLMGIVSPVVLCAKKKKKKNSKEIQYGMMSCLNWLFNFEYL